MMLPLGNSSDLIWTVQPLPNAMVGTHFQPRPAMIFRMVQPWTPVLGPDFPRLLLDGFSSSHPMPTN